MGTIWGDDEICGIDGSRTLPNYFLWPEIEEEEPDPHPDDNKPDSNAGGLIGNRPKFLSIRSAELCPTSAVILTS